VPLVRARVERVIKQGEEEEMSSRLDRKERELESLEETHPNLVFLVKRFIDGLTSVIQNQLGPEDVVWFRYYCANFFLEVFGAIAESYRRGK